MILYLIFGFWEFVLRIYLSFLVFWLQCFRMFLIVSIPATFLVFMIILVARTVHKITLIPSDEMRSPEEIITSRGFQVETHRVATKDGYVLVLHRVINPFIKREVLETKPVLLEHGYGTHGMMWCLNGDSDWSLRKVLTEASETDDENDNLKVNDALGFDLALRGYDVWLGNQRGNRFSTEHHRLDRVRNADKYWDFSLDEIISYDLTATIDYILAETRQKTLSYVGISQGATIMFGLLASRPKYNEIVKPFIAIAPVTTAKNSGFFKRFPKVMMKNAVYYADKFPGQLYPRFLEFVIQFFFCNHSFQGVSNIIGSKLFAGKHTNTKRVNVFLAFPGIHCSRKNGAQLIQFHFGEFAKYDYGTRKNKRVYGSDKPPSYDLGAITNPNIALLYSRDDSMASTQDIQILKKALKVPLIDDFTVRKKKWDHQDFQLGKDAGKYVNSRIVKILHSCVNADSIKSHLAQRNDREQVKRERQKLTRRFLESPDSTLSSSSFEVLPFPEVDVEEQMLLRRQVSSSTDRKTSF